MWRGLKNIYHLLQSVGAATWYGYPAKELTVIGVTGTDGKTTTVHLIAEILKAAKQPVSYVSSIAANISGKEIDTGFHVTTPSPIAVQRLLAKAVNAGSKYMILEVTSHGLDQNRVFACDFKIGVVTNITSEHLDYHKNFKNYRKAKAKLIKKANIAILNFDDPSFDYLKTQTKGKITSFGKSQKADINPKSFPFKLNLVGDYNIYNALAAIAVGKELKLRDEIISRAIEKFKALPGRMEEVNFGQKFKIVVDFAHTPNALEQALLTLRSALSTKRSKLISIFGCAGERDKQKRPFMGKASAKLADYTVLTAEDPRLEDVNKIIDQIATGCEEQGVRQYQKLAKANNPAIKYYFKIPSRFEAIRFAINSLAKDGDTVAIFGKGHEKSIAYGKSEYPWSDIKAVKLVLKGEKWKI